ncbi:MAG: cyclodeaminase/cyclohydrolase family protein [Caulobacteraceae bacterium]
MPELSAQTVRQVYEAAGSTAPAPGGGAVTSLAGMLGIALILKALRISLRKRDDAADYAPVDAALDGLAQALERDADADSAAFEGFIRASKFPRATDEEKAVRAAALERAAMEAAEAALATLEHAVEAIAQARRLRGVIAANITGDILAGVQLLEAARTVAIDNAEANLAAVKAEAAREPSPNAWRR